MARKAPEPSVDLEVSYEASPLQEGMIFHNLKEAKPGVDIVQIVGDLEEDLRLPAFEQAWRQITQRHPILRTHFRWEALDRPRQEVRSKTEVHIETADWSSLPAHAQGERLESWLRADRRRGFDLSAPPLMRWNVMRLGSVRCWFVWTFHHALLDARSFALVLKEFFSLYDSAPNASFNAPIRYQDYLAWLHARDLAPAEKFWRQRLKDFAAPTEITFRTTETSVAEMEPGSAEQHCELSPELSRALRVLARQHGLTVNTLVHGAWAILLSRYSGQEEVVFGAVRGCRDSDFPGVESVVGLLINTLPLRVQIERASRLTDWLRQLREQWHGLRGYEHTPLVKIQQWSELPSGTPLFETIVNYHPCPWDTALRTADGASARRTFSLRVQTNYPLLLDVCGEPEIILKLVFDRPQFDSSGIQGMLRHLRTLLEGMVADPAQCVGELAAMNPAEERAARQQWNRTEAAPTEWWSVSERVEEQARRRPEATAVVCGPDQLSYAELWQRVELVADRLREAGVGPEITVGVCVERSAAMVVALLGVLKAGGAFVPLDPAYPEERLRYTLEDSQASVLLAQNHWIRRLCGPDAAPVALTQADHEPKTLRSSAFTLLLAPLWSRTLKRPEGRDPKTSLAESLAYVIYTSGSTGKPKGVMVSHRNLANLFAAIDEVLGTDPGVWLAVSRFSFDISILELVWTLSHGFKVVIQQDPATHRQPEVTHSTRAKSTTDLTDDTDRITADLSTSYSSAPSRAIRDQTSASFENLDQSSSFNGKSRLHRQVDFSLFYFACDEARQGADKYRLLLEGAKFADQHGFAAVWTPERHFHRFGGLYPNPSVTSAALAMVTEKIQLRAGSVVLPLHNPLRVVEEWAVVDNLSNGRIGVSFASGWHANDFVFAPNKFAERRRLFREGIELTRQLWRGEPLRCRNGEDAEVEVRAGLRPVQRELPIWITAAGNPETFQFAGEIGANLLTNLLGQTVEDLAQKISLYREAWRKAGHGPGPGRVAVMLHTFVSENLEHARQQVRKPFIEYLKTSTDLIRAANWKFPTFERSRSNGHLRSEAENISEEAMEEMAALGFERYFTTSGLFGPPDVCLRLVERLKSIGVDEAACLIDFGVEADAVLASLERLNAVRKRANGIDSPPHGVNGNGQAAKLVSQPREQTSFSSLIHRHGVTHLQCTPALASALVDDPQALDALRSLRALMLGGEAMPAPLSRRLIETLPGEFWNFYGPTETTIWSTAFRFTQNDSSVCIGRPLRGTQVHILDRHFQPVPIGAAGELFVGGQGVARGYQRRPDWTAERFVPDPFSEQPGARLYRTGDSGRFLPDGNIEFIGRTDQQVKIRGHRVELGEIESVLAEHPAVRAAVVTSFEDPINGHRLEAYVEPRRVPPSHEPGRDGFHSAPDFTQQSEGQYQGRGGTRPYQFMDRDKAPGLQEETVSSWRQVWDTIYSQEPSSPDPTFNLLGWRSSYDGSSLSEAEMREWLETTTQRILTLQPKRVLEIGCGLGLLLFRIAPRCEVYQATDFSESALRFLEPHLRARALNQVKLSRREAGDFSGIEPGAFDTIILNSVAQYFPNRDYLLRVLEQAARVVAPGGAIFLGDLRSLPLLDLFHTAVELSKAPPDLTLRDLSQRIRSRVEQENELLIAPDLFIALKNAWPRLGEVRIELKRGRFHNELTAFRYDVTLRLARTEGDGQGNEDVPPRPARSEWGEDRGEGKAHEDGPPLPGPLLRLQGREGEIPASSSRPCFDSTAVEVGVPSTTGAQFCSEQPPFQQTFDWKVGRPTLEDIRGLLDGGQAESLALKCVPNSRLNKAVAAWGLIATCQDRMPVSELRRLVEQKPMDALDPEELWALGEEFPRAVEIAWSPGRDDGAFDVFFHSPKHSLRNRRSDLLRVPRLEPNPLTPALSPTGGEGVRRTGEGESGRFMAPMDEKYTNHPQVPNIAQDLPQILKDHLRSCLPEYMIPATLTVVDQLPRTPNGKINRKALPRPDGAAAKPGGEFQAPRNELEKVIARVIQEALQTERVDVEENFFDLGVHSLLAMRAANRLRQVIGRSVKLLHLFQYPTVAALAAYLSETRETTVVVDAGRARGDKRRTALFRRYA